MCIREYLPSKNFSLSLAPTAACFSDGLSRQHGYLFFSEAHLLTKLTEGVGRARKGKTEKEACNKRAV